MSIARIAPLIIVTAIILFGITNPAMGRETLPALTGLLPRATPPARSPACAGYPGAYRLMQKLNRPDGALLAGAVMQLQLGVHMHAVGQFSKALYWFERAADKSIPEAYFNIAQLHHFGEGVPVDLITAERFYRRGAALGDTESMINLALLLSDKPGQSSDLRLEIRQLLDEATLQNDPKAPLLSAKPTGTRCSGY